MRRAVWLASLGMIAALSSCGGSPPQPPAPPAPKPASGAGAPAVATPPAPPGQSPASGAQPQPPADAMKTAGRALTPPAPRYEVKGRRDPFENLEVKLKERERAGGFSIASARLTGIVQGRTTLALIETPEGFGYILKPGDTIGDGRLIEIGRDTAVFAVTPKPGSTSNRVVLKIVTD